MALEDNVDKNGVAKKSLVRKSVAQVPLADWEIDILAKEQATQDLIETYPGPFQVLYEGYREEIKRNQKKPLLRRPTGKEKTK